MTQYRLFDEKPSIQRLDAKLWHGSFNARENSLQQLSPYVGKLKTGMVQVLLDLYSRPHDRVLDPFSGSGVVALQSVLMERYALANDLSPYAYALTRGKLEAPENLETACQRAEKAICAANMVADSVAVDAVPKWIQEFYHPQTMREIVATFEILHRQSDYFLLACLLGIMHHVRPGFLSYPASHLVPYLRKAKFPPEQFPEMYAYRNLRTRLLAKVNRAYRRAELPPDWNERKYQVWMENAQQLPIESESIDAIVSSPPYFGALDYARDNRLRLWFLGCHDWKALDGELTANQKVYLTEMRACLREMWRVLKPSSYCVLVLGDVERDGKTHRTAEILGELAVQETNGDLSVVEIYDDRIPDERRSRRRTKTTAFERILVMRKS